MASACFPTSPSASSHLPTALVLPGGDLWDADQHPATAGLARAGLLEHRGLITAGPTEAVEFARAALEQLDIFEPETLDAWYRLFGQQDPSGFAAMAR